MKKQNYSELLDLKICGINDIDTINFLITNPVKYFGLIFYKKSPRYVSPDQAKELIEISKNSKINAVGVFVDFDITKLQEYIDSLGLKYIQLHGNEDNSFINKLKNKIDVNVIKVIRIEDRKDLNIINDYPDADYLLFDYKSKKHDLPGGNAKTFDWNKLKNINISKKWFLSGGINYNNIKNALEILNPYGIDISSGVEDSPGVKNKEKIKKIIEILNNNNEHK
ncbi:MAG: hypothetical protein CMI95_01365 [Pelagibacteraceae bacterium]|nr:hypothetical protein [Pelagibacteraceae bacterium]PPR52160.1 MAG: N-(5'-phosphoribosyl)anthranilate isomerase [Alphaproteobacteria bacterium MarineAlpha5_Bin10]|tara:strand:- start:7406 stop:8077 length:672 start_codon:yes stop_codon:yes gene_type:complete